MDYSAMSRGDSSRAPARLLPAAVFLTLLLPLVSPAHAAPFVYVASRASDQVIVLDAETRRIVAAVPVGNDAWAVAVRPDGRRVYVSNSVGDSVSVIDRRSNTVVALIPAGNEPRRMAISADGGRLYVSNWRSASVSVIDTATDTVVNTIGVGDFPAGIAVNPAGTRVYVADNDIASDIDSVSVIDTASGSVIDTVDVGSAPEGVVISPDGSRLYVANRYSHTVSVIDTLGNVVVDTVQLGDLHFPMALAITPDGATVYVVNDGAVDTVSAIDTALDEVVATIDLGFSISDFVFHAEIAVDSTGERAYVADFGCFGCAGTVSVIDVATHSLARLVFAGASPHGIAVTPQPVTVELAPVTAPLSPGDTLVASATLTNRSEQTQVVGLRFYVRRPGSQDVQAFSSGNVEIAAGDTLLREATLALPAQAPPGNWGLASGVLQAGVGDVDSDRTSFEVR